MKSLNALVEDTLAGALQERFGQHARKRRLAPFCRPARRHGTSKAGKAGHVAVKTRRKGLFGRQSTLRGKGLIGRQSTLRGKGLIWRQSTLRGKRLVEEEGDASQAGYSVEGPAGKVSSKKKGQSAWIAGLAGTATVAAATRSSSSRPAAASHQKTATARSRRTPASASPRKPGRLPCTIKRSEAGCRLAPGPLRAANQAAASFPSPDNPVPSATQFAWRARPNSRLRLRCRGPFVQRQPRRRGPHGRAAIAMRVLLLFNHPATIAAAASLRICPSGGLKRMPIFQSRSGWCLASRYFMTTSSDGGIPGSWKTTQRLATARRVLASQTSSRPCGRRGIR